MAKRVFSVLCKDTRPSLSGNACERGLVIHEDIFWRICRYQDIVSLHRGYAPELVHA